MSYIQDKKIENYKKIFDLVIVIPGQPPPPKKKGVAQMYVVIIHLQYDIFGRALKLV